LDDVRNNREGRFVSQHQEIGIQTSDSLTTGIVKVGSTWFLVLLSKLGIHGWSDMSAVLACVVSILFIGDFIWKKYKLIRSGNMSDAS
jgi:hypothetical protein